MLVLEAEVVEVGVDMEVEVEAEVGMDFPSSLLVFYSSCFALT